MSAGNCTIYYPGLLGPTASLQELDKDAWPDKHELPVLNRIFSQGRICAADSTSHKSPVERHILELFGVTTQANQIPVAELRHNYYDCATEYKWCLDPVHIQVDLDEVILLASNELLLDENEARQIINDMNQHFAQDDLQIEYCAPHEWLLKGRFDLGSSPPSQVLYKNINSYLPRGNDERRWQQVINEIQMLLHAHPVNEKRQLQGKLTINSLWLWGNGIYKSIEAPFEFIYSDDALASQVASLANITHEPLPETLDTTKLASRISMIVMTAQMDVIRRNDVFGWFDALKYFDKQVLAPIYDLLGKRQLDWLVIHSDGIKIIVEQSAIRHAVLSWLKPARSFQKQIMRLRSQYAD